jgi:nucleoside 2-deoxyribosyltransferase
MIYLAGPIDRAPSHQNWRNEARSKLRVYGFTCYDPYAAFQNRPANGDRQKLSAINRYAITRCDIMLVHLHFGVPMLGTIREIELATHLDAPIPVVVFGESIESLNLHTEAWDLIAEQDLDGAIRRVLSHFYNPEQNEKRQTT